MADAGIPFEYPVENVVAENGREIAGHALGSRLRYQPRRSSTKVSSAVPSSSRVTVCEAISYSCPTESSGLPSSTSVAFPGDNARSSWATRIVISRRFTGAA